MKIIAHKRTRLGLSQAELAKKLGVSQAAVSLWELGSASPNSSLLLKLADALECTVDELLKEG